MNIFCHQSVFSSLPIFSISFPSRGNTPNHFTSWFICIVVFDIKSHLISLSECFLILTFDGSWCSGSWSCSEFFGSCFLWFTHFSWFAFDDGLWGNSAHSFVLETIWFVSSVNLSSYWIFHFHLSIRFVCFDRKTWFCLNCWQNDYISSLYALRLPSSPDRQSVSFYSFTDVQALEFYCHLCLAAEENCFLSFLRIFQAFMFGFPCFQS